MSLYRADLVLGASDHSRCLWTTRGVTLRNKGLLVGGQDRRQPTTDAHDPHAPDRADNAHDVPVLKYIGWHHEPVVDPGRNHCVAHIGVDVVGKVDHGRPTRQVYDLPKAGRDFRGSGQAAPPERGRAGTRAAQQTRDSPPPWA